MSSPRENLIEALEGRTPAQTPLSIYDWMIETRHTPDPIRGLAEAMARDDWRRLFDLGLGVTCHVEAIEAVEHDVVLTERTETHQGADITIRERTCPAGRLREVVRNGWHEEHWLKTTDDYRTAAWIAAHTEWIAHPERVAEAEAVVGDLGVVVLTGAGRWLHRTPAMDINVDLAGTEQFCLDIALEVPELFELYAVKRERFIEQQHLLAATPGRYVKWLENLTISMLGPQRYRDLLVSVYDEAVPILEAAEKRIMVHYDGNLGCITDAIREAPFHMIESLTEPPEGDMLYDQCRAAWPDKVLWANINIGLYTQPSEVLRQAVIDKWERAGKRGFAFELSEDCPPNWRESIPVVLATLRELG